MKSLSQISFLARSFKNTVKTGIMLLFLIFTGFLPMVSVKRHIILLRVLKRYFECIFVLSVQCLKKLDILALTRSIKLF